MNLQERLRYHVTGAIERGESEPITENTMNKQYAFAPPFVKLPELDDERQVEMVGDIVWITTGQNHIIYIDQSIDGELIISVGRNSDVPDRVIFDQSDFIGE